MRTDNRGVKLIPDPNCPTWIEEYPILFGWRYLLSHYFFVPIKWLVKKEKKRCFYYLPEQNAAICSYQTYNDLKCQPLKS